MAADALGLDSFGGFAAGTIEEQHRRQAELAREVVDDLNRRAAVVVQKTAVRAQPAELDGEAAAVIGTAAFGDHGQVFWRQAPMPRQFVLARVGRRRHRRRDACDGGRDLPADIEVRALQVGREIIAGWSRIGGRGVEGLVTKQAGQFNQFPGVVAKSRLKRGG